MAFESSLQEQPLQASAVPMQISESFNRFGVTESCQHLLVARFDADAEEVITSCIYIIVCVHV